MLERPSESLEHAGCRRGRCGERRRRRATLLPGRRRRSRRGTALGGGSLLLFHVVHGRVQVPLSADVIAKDEPQLSAPIPSRPAFRMTASTLMIRLENRPRMTSGIHRRTIYCRQLVGRFGSLTVINHMRSEQPSPAVLLNPAGIAAQLGVSRTWLYDAAKAGHVPSIRIRRREGPLRIVPVGANSESERHTLVGCFSERANSIAASARLRSPTP